jgi:cytochrome c1
MRKRVFAHSEESYQAWVTKMKTPVVLEDKQLQTDGEALFSSAGCAGCHSILGNKTANGKTGPNLTHFGDRHSVGAGAGLFDPDGKMMLEAEKLELLKHWIHDPDAIKYGTTMKTEASRVLDGMNIPRELTDAEVDTLARYLLAQK